MNDHDEQVTSSQWAPLDAGAAVARAQHPVARGLDQADRQPPADETETMPASLYDPHASGHRPSAVGESYALEPIDALSAADFAALQSEYLVTTKDKFIAATLALLARHDASRLSRDHFASDTLYRNAVRSSTSSKSHAMQILLAASRIEGLPPNHLIMACEPPLGLDIVSGRYVMSVVGNGVHHHHVSMYVVRMLARALTTFWSDVHLNAREQAYKHLPPQTADIYF